MGIKQRIQRAKTTVDVAKLSNEALKAYEDGMSADTLRKCKREAAKRLTELTK